MLVSIQIRVATLKLLLINVRLCRLTVLCCKQSSLLQKLLSLFILTLLLLLPLCRCRGHHLNMLWRTILSYKLIWPHFLSRYTLVASLSIEILKLSFSFAVSFLQLLPTMRRRAWSLLFVWWRTRTSRVILRVPRTTANCSIKCRK